MTAAELNQLVADKAEETALYNGLTDQARLTGRLYGWSLPEYTAREARQRAAESSNP
jgi:hypothetical protein